MTLSNGQVSVRTLVMGPGTAYRVLNLTDLWSRTVTADQSGPRVRNHGSWSGAEFADEAVLPLRIHVSGVGAGGWLSAHRVLAAAFAPSSVDVQLRYSFGGAEYVLFGRPRMVEPGVDTIGLGHAITRCAFVALDPLTYSGTLHSATLSPPTFSGGLLVPALAPTLVGSVATGGDQAVTNAGTAETGLTLRIDGPIIGSRLSVQRADGVTQTLTVDVDLAAGQWLDVDTRMETVLANGSASASRRGFASGEFPLLPPGVSTVAFRGSGSGMLTVSWRDAWY